MTGRAVTMSRQMTESESPVGGVPPADPLLSESESGPDLAQPESDGPATGPGGSATESAGSAPESAGSADEPEVEIVDGLPVLAEVRTVERVAPAALPAVQVAAVAATGFVAGAATVALVKRRSARKMVRNSRTGPRRAADLLPIAASRSFLVDVHVIAKPE
jgi:hypothetical protein